MNKKIIFISAAIFFGIVFSFGLSASRMCYDYLLLDGSEPLVDYGLDTTDHWWAVTAPFANNFRLIVDGEMSDVYRQIDYPVFSPDGERWACFVSDNVRWYILTEDTIFALPGNLPGEIAYSPDSKVMAYSYFDGSVETIVYGEKKIRVSNRFGKFYLNQDGSKIAFTGYVGDRVSLNFGHKKFGSTYDEIIPFGFWHTDEFLFAARNGGMWEIYKGDRAISEKYRQIYETAINLFGDCAGALAVNSIGRRVGLTISDDYYEPKRSVTYDMAQNLALHPYLPLIAFNARINDRNYVVYSSAEYEAGLDTGAPRFTHDGENLYFIGCNLYCFVNVDGQEIESNTTLSLDRVYAMKPNSETVAYSTSSSLVVRFVKTNYLHSGMMVDETIHPRWNWRRESYEAPGVINNRLYLLTCELPG